MGGSRYLVKRLLFAFVTILVAATLNFVLFRLAPGNAAQSLSHVPGASAALQHALLKEFGLNKPELQQYFLYLKDLVTGHLGVSFANRQPVTSNLAHELLNTIPMVGAGTVIAIVVGLGVGVLSAGRRGTLWDHASLGASMILYSLPVQWVGLMLILIFSGVLPSSGDQNYFLVNPSTLQRLLDEGEHMILPSLTFALTLVGQFALVGRASMLDTLGEDYILTARAKGLGRWAIVWRHAVPNARLPTIALIALSLGYIVGGAILVEVVFSWPGIGLGTYQAVTSRDYPMLQGQFLVLAIAVVLCNLAADVVMARLDPRVRMVR